MTTSISVGLDVVARSASPTACGIRSKVRIQVNAAETARTSRIAEVVTTVLRSACQIARLEEQEREIALGRHGIGMR